MMAPPTFNNSDSGGYTGGGFNNLAINYYSPWDIWYNRGSGYVDFQPSYVISNGDVEENYSPYRLEVFAWIGLAYFDGDNEGTFNDFHSASSFPLNTTNYPTLFANNQEVGNLVRTDSSLDFDPLQGARIEDHIDHLPMPGGSKPRFTSLTPPWPFGPWAPGFDCTGLYYH